MSAHMTEQKDNGPVIPTQVKRTFTGAVRHVAHRPPEAEDPEAMDSGTDSEDNLDFNKIFAADDASTDQQESIVRDHTFTMATILSTSMTDTKSADKAAAMLRLNLPTHLHGSVRIGMYSSGARTGKILIDFKSKEEAMEFMKGFANFKDETQIFEMNVDHQKCEYTTYTNPDALEFVIKVKGMKLKASDMPAPKLVPTASKGGRRSIPKKSTPTGIQAYAAREAVRRLLTSFMKQQRVTFASINFSLQVFTSDWQTKKTVDLRLVACSRESRDDMALALECHPDMLVTNPQTYSSVTDLETGGKPWHLCDFWCKDCIVQKDGSTPTCKREHMQRLCIYTTAPRPGLLAPPIPRASLDKIKAHLAKANLGGVLSVHFNSVEKNPRAAPRIFIDAVTDKKAFKTHSRTLRPLTQMQDDGLQWTQAKVACDPCGTFGEHSTSKCHRKAANDTNHVLLSTKGGANSLNQCKKLHCPMSTECAQGHHGRVEGTYKGEPHMVYQHEPSSSAHQGGHQGIGKNKSGPCTTLTTTKPFAYVDPDSIRNRRVIDPYEDKGTKMEPDSPSMAYGKHVNYHIMGSTQFDKVLVGATAVLPDIYKQDHCVEMPHIVETLGLQDFGASLCALSSGQDMGLNLLQSLNLTDPGARALLSSSPRLRPIASALLGTTLSMSAAKSWANTVPSNDIGLFLGTAAAVDVAVLMVESSVRMDNNSYNARLRLSWFGPTNTKDAIMVYRQWMHKGVDRRCAVVPLSLVWGNGHTPPRATLAGTKEGDQARQAFLNGLKAHRKDRTNSEKTIAMYGPPHEDWVQHPKDMVDFDAALQRGALHASPTSPPPLPKAKDAGQTAALAAPPPLPKPLPAASSGTEKKAKKAKTAAAPTKANQAGGSLSAQLHGDQVDPPNNLNHDTRTSAHHAPTRRAHDRTHVSETDLCLNTCAHKHTYTRNHTTRQQPRHTSRSCAPALPHSRALSPSRSHTPVPARSCALALPRARALVPPRSRTASLTHSVSHTQCPTNTVSPTHRTPHTQCPTHTVSHTHSVSHTQ